jgi:hypothetical protein
MKNMLLYRLATIYTSDEVITKGPGKIFEISNSLIFKNQLEFIKINDTTPLNSNPKNVFFVTLQLQYETLNDKLFNKHVFANTEVLSVSGILSTIEEELFRDFNRIRVLFISIENLKSFFHSGTKWMNGLNSSRVREKDPKSHPNKSGLLICSALLVD